MEMKNETADLPASSPESLQFEFTGDAVEFFKIWIVNICLTIVTLGIYSAWAKVRTYKYFYGNTILAGSSFEYLASPITILKGRLIAFALFVIYSVATTFFPLSAIIFTLAFLFVLPWLVVKSLTFRARNTAYRNIRFDFKNNYSAAAVTFILLPVLIVFTLGLIVPYMVFYQSKFIIENNMYGKEGFVFKSKGIEFYKIYLMALLILVIGGVLAALAAQLHPFMLAVIMAPVYFFVFAYLKTKVANLVYNSTTLKDNQLASSMQPNEVFVLYFTNAVAIILSVGLLIPWALIRMARYRAEKLQLHTKEGLDHFVAGQQAAVSATGEEMGEVFDVELGL